MSIEKVAVLGAGNGGCATAADLAIRGFETRLYSRSKKTLEPLLRRGGIELVEHGQETFGRPHLITPSLDEAVAGADLVTIAVPAVAHGFMARALAPLLTEHQIVHLNPGQTGGSLHFVHELRRAGCRIPVQCCETVTLTSICRMAGPARVEVYRRTANLGCAAFPADSGPDILPDIAAVFPNIVPAENVLETGLSNINAIMHPAGMVGNAGWIEQHGGELLFYRQALSPSVARLIEGVDRERLAIVCALGLRPRTFVEIFHAAGLTSDAALGKRLRLPGHPGERAQQDHRGPEDPRPPLRARRRGLRPRTHGRARCPAGHRHSRHRCAHHPGLGDEPHRLPPHRAHPEPIWGWTAPTPARCRMSCKPGYQ